VTRLKERLRSAIERGQQPRYVRMIEGQIRNIEQEYNIRAREIELRRDVSISFRSIAAGMVRVME
jgi:hypothetical protein